MFYSLLIGLRHGLDFENTSHIGRNSCSGKAFLDRIVKLVFAGHSKGLIIYGLGAD